MLDNQLLEKANQPQDRKTGKNTGGVLFKKGDGSQGYAAEVLRLLLDNDGTLVWDMKDERNGIGVFNTIYEFAAAEIHAKDSRLRDRIAAAEEHAFEAQSGFNVLARWLDERFDRPLFRLKGTKGNKIAVITVDGNFIDPVTNLTAQECQYERSRDQADGQIHSFVKKARQIRGPEQALQALSELMGKQALLWQTENKQIEKD
jgi:hypothetical protein